MAAGSKQGPRKQKGTQQAPPAVNPRNPPRPILTPPEVAFMGKTYSDWIEDWTRWFFLPNADQYNDGPVVFLNGMPRSQTGGYKEDGVIMVGTDSIEISASQRILLPMITSTVFAEAGETSQALYDLARADIDNGEDPPHNSHVKINNRDIMNAPNTWAKYRFETRVFEINMPSSTYGQSLADLVIPPIKTRDTNLPCVTVGYFALLEFGTPNTTYDYDIFSSVHGSRDQYGLYKSSLLYHLRVQPSLRYAIGPTHVASLSGALSANFKAGLRKKLKEGVIDFKEYKRLEQLI